MLLSERILKTGYTKSTSRTFSGIRYSWQRCAKVVCQSGNDKNDRGNIGDELLDFM